MSVIKIKKLLIPIFSLFFLLLITSTCTADFNVTPRELNITMSNEFINGNTSKEIIVINNDNDKSVNISWYLSDPEPISSMRANKTTIPDLNWIDLEPKWQIIPANSYAIFYIHLNIPEIFENFDKSWESWITFKSETTGFINIEHAVRFYIDTPVNTCILEDKTQSNGSIENILIIAVVAFLIIMFIILILKFFIIKK
jgi:hypothetical protein